MRHVDTDTLHLFVAPTTVGFSRRRILRRLQTRLSAEFVADLEGILGEHEGDLEANVQRSPKPGQTGPVFPAMIIHKLINHHILVGK